MLFKYKEIDKVNFVRYYNNKKGGCVKDIMDNVIKKMQLAGWTSEELGKKVGVTKQTISNLETGRSQMTKMQYIAIRTVLEYQAQNNENLAKALHLVLDDENASEKQQKENEEKVKAVAAATAAGVSGLALGSLLGVATIAFGAWLTILDKDK